MSVFTSRLMEHIVRWLARRYIDSIMMTTVSNNLPLNVWIFWRYEQKMLRNISFFFSFCVSTLNTLSRGMLRKRFFTRDKSKVHIMVTKSTIMNFQPRAIERVNGRSTSLPHQVCQICSLHISSNYKLTFFQHSIRYIFEVEPQLKGCSQNMYTKERRLL